MNDDAAFERLLADRIADSGRVTARPGAADRIIAQARRSRPSPRWLAILKEPPMRHASRVVVGSPTARVAVFAVVTLLVATLGAGALVAGAQSPSPAPPEVPTEMRPAWVTGVARQPEGQYTQETQVVGGVESLVTHWIDIPMEMSDPRLTGTASFVNITLEHPVEDDAPIVVGTHMNTESRTTAVVGKAQGPGWSEASSAPPTTRRSPIRRSSLAAVRTRG
jgi:hypothetical protein